MYYFADTIFKVHLNSYQIDTLNASIVYTFIDNEKLIYYNKSQKRVFFDGKSFVIDEFPNQFLQYKGRILAISKHNIFELKGADFISIYKFKGKFFDAKIINDEFYFVDKFEKRKNEGFSLYKTSDFNRILLIDKLDELNR